MGALRILVWTLNDRSLFKLLCRPIWRSSGYDTGLDRLMLDIDRRKPTSTALSCDHCEQSENTLSVTPFANFTGKDVDAVANGALTPILVLVLRWLVEDERKEMKEKG